MALVTREFPVPGFDFGMAASFFAVSLGVFWLLTLVVGSALLALLGDRVAYRLGLSVLAGCIVAAPVSMLLLLFEAGEAISEERGQLLTRNGLLMDVSAAFALVAGAVGGYLFWLVSTCRNPQASGTAAPAS